MQNNRENLSSVFYHLYEFSLRYFIGVDSQVCRVNVLWVVNVMPVLHVRLVLPIPHLVMPKMFSVPFTHSSG
jgi:hypothetical protein